MQQRNKQPFSPSKGDRGSASTNASVNSPTDDQSHSSFSFPSVFSPKGGSGSGGGSGVPGGVPQEMYDMMKAKYMCLELTVKNNVEIMQNLTNEIKNKEKHINEMSGVFEQRMREKDEIAYSLRQELNGI